MLWPQTCPFCGKVNRSGVCAACSAVADRLLIREPRCMKCGKPVRYREQEYCYDCRRIPHYYDRGAAVWLHRDPVSRSIYQFKYHDQRSYARFYAEAMAARYGRTIRRWDPQAIIPVPLHSRRRRRRGYNQAELLARELGKITGIPVMKKLVRRVHFTRPQKQFDSRMRRKNLEHAFAPGTEKGRWPAGLQRVLVVDDIYTTGNTIDQVAKILKDRGVQKVYFLTISIGQGY